MPKMQDVDNKSWRFYGGTLTYDGRGYLIKLNESAGAGEIYLERNEASSLASLMWVLLFKKKQER